MSDDAPGSGGTLWRRAAAIAGAAASVLFIVNPGLGVFAEIPDNLPIIGNLDEAAATALLIYCLRALAGSRRRSP